MTMPDFLALPSAAESLAIAAMAAATYSTRIIGWLLLRGRTLSPRLKRTLDASPCCVMAAIVAPAFMTTEPTTLISLAVALVAARTGSLALTVAAAVLSNALLRLCFG